MASNNQENFINNDTDPIIADEEEILARQNSSRNKWAILGGFFALSSSLVYTFYGLLIKQFNVDFVDTLFVRSVIQTVLISVYVKIRKKNLFPVFDLGEDKWYIVKKYSVLILQGILAGLNMMCVYLGVSYIPLGDALTIIYAGPIFTMIFSYMFLRIKQGLWKISFALILMTGVVLVIRPPVLFPEDGSLCPENNNTIFNLSNSHYFVQEFELEVQKPKNYWLGVAVCIAAAAIGGLINVCIAYLKDIDNGTIMVWSGTMSILCSFMYLTFDHNSRIFFLGQIDLTTAWHWVALSLISITANWLATASYQLLDPTICSIFRAQEVVFAYVVQAIILHFVPCYISFIGAGLVVLSAICSPLEKFVVPKLPGLCSRIC